MAPPRRRSVAAAEREHNNHHSDPECDDSDLPPPYDPDLVSSSLLEPRIAVVLNVPKPWRVWLFFCRLLSILPAIFYAIQPAVTLLVQVVPVAVPGGRKSLAGGSAAGMGGAAGEGAASYAALVGVAACPPSSWPPEHPEIPFPWTEMSLGLLWCGCSAYLDFFFVDCLMSRWLINYTPQATIIRLLTVTSVNAFLTERILTFSGGFEDPRLLLPGWVTIATTLTIAYHITQRKINIKKETSTSINIFSIASFVSMVALLAQMHYSGSDYPSKPFEPLLRPLYEYVTRAVCDNLGPPASPSSSHPEL
ncbi:N-glycosylation protein eos1 [Colletotrichum sojae]|uniref:N-glycosylation protein eos1 n=1 Tax=Colletotrichum sojae TaxID=2175907 RepID=A0A8H6MWV2_9PEZI|nr:N-glycosylation protein eos1 [Colletotrichum sojae]